MTQIKNATIIGTGNMTRSIAAAFAGSGTSVRITGRSFAKAQLAASDATARTSGRAGPISACELGPQAFDGADLVLENVVEDAGIKRGLLARVDAWLADGAFVATDTSSLSIGDLARALARPQRFAGMHFLNPADQTHLVEVCRGPQTSDDTIHALADYVRYLGKRPLVVNKDVPGFIWNRLQAALAREAFHLLHEGIAGIEDIDAAVSDALAARWLATGPFASADLGGIDTWRRVGRILFPHLCNDAAPPDVLGSCFYEWTDEARDAVFQLRARTLAAGRAFASERTTVTPTPRRD